jgi:hypothetical protein
VASGVITEIGTSFPGYTGRMPKSRAMVSEIVRPAYLLLARNPVAILADTIHNVG